MVFRCRRFNLYLAVVALVVIASACQSPEKQRQKKLSTFRLYLESTENPTNRTVNVQVYRAAPVIIRIDRSPIVTEERVKEAKVVDSMGGFAMQVQLDRAGGYLLEQYTSNFRGRHLVIFSQFAQPGNPKVEEGRWLAAPLITAPITSGKLLFTPDATREEAEQIATGLNNVARKLHTGEEPFN